MALTLLIFLLFTTLVLPRQARLADQNTGGSGSPDTSFFYTREILYQYAQEYGAAGRQAYIRARYTFDVIWPLVYTAFLTAGISWFGKQVPWGETFWRKAPLLPMLGTLFDYLENAATSLVMAAYPLRINLAAGAAPGFTLIKWLMVAGSFGLYLLGFSLSAYHRLKAYLANRSSASK